MTDTKERRAILADWIQDAMNDTDYEQPLSQMALVIMNGLSECEIKTLQIGANFPMTALQLGDYFHRKAKQYIQDLPGVHQFKIHAFYGSNQPRQSHPFMMAGQLDNNGMGTEQPTPTGRLMQHMRHEEILMQGMMTERLAIMRNSIDMNRELMNHLRELNAQNIALRKESDDAFKIGHEAILKEATQNHEAEMKRLEFERATKERAKLMGMAPIVVNRLFGREVIPESASDTALIEYFAENVTEEGLEKIIATGAIPQEAVPLLVARFAEILKKKREEEAQARARPPETESDVEADPEANKIVTLRKVEGQ